MRVLAITATAQPNTATYYTTPSFSSHHDANNITNTTTTTTTTTSLPFNKSQISWGRLKRGLGQCKLGHNWMQYQGINHWEGLLDPLDDNLRSEILRYGQFVEAAYRSFDFDTSSPAYATCRYPKTSLLARSGFHNSGYKITKNLRATSGVQLPKWLNNMYQLPRHRSSWIGYVAVCQDKKEIARLGRRDVVIALRGTATCSEWLENLRATLTELPNHMTNNNNNNNAGTPTPTPTPPPMVENGFLSLYVSKTSTTPSLQDTVREQIGRVIESYGDEPLSLTITGHSLGAALAILSAYDITNTFNHKAPMVTVVSFGGPRVGNDVFRNQLEQSGTRILRIVNSEDVITKVPGFVVRSDDVAGNGNAHVARLQRWFHKRVEEMQLVYADVGQELKLSSRESPYFKRGDVATCHDLKTYLHLVDMAL